MKFTDIAKRYEKYAVVQKSASEILLTLLDIKENNDVLDLGCGTGKLTRKIRKLTKGKVVGVDPSEGMIREAIKRSKNMDIIYEIKSAEDIDYKHTFDIIFCNSAFQWFKDPYKAIKNCYKALKPGGKIGIQAPAKKVYCPNFIKAIENVKNDNRTKRIFRYFKNPWFFLESADEYKTLFEDCGFKVIFAEIKKIVSEHTPDEVFNIFSSGAIAGYLNQDYYNIKLTDRYITAFKEIIKDSFKQQVDSTGVIKLEFNRIFLIGKKEE